jgi:hypothetical protein
MDHLHREPTQDPFQFSRSGTSLVPLTIKETEGPERALIPAHTCFWSLEGRGTVSPTCLPIQENYPLARTDPRNSSREATSLAAECHHRRGGGASLFPQPACAQGRVGQPKRWVIPRREHGSAIRTP